MENEKDDDNICSRDYGQNKLDSVRIKKESMILECRRGKPWFKCLRKKTSYPGKMGFSRLDGHFFLVEEALYLAQNGVALVKCEGRACTIAQIHKLLNENRISTMKYVVFSHLVRSGYIVRRTTIPIIDGSLLDDGQETNTKDDYRTTGPSYSFSSELFRFPESLFKQFPCISHDCQSICLPGITELPPDHCLLNDIELSIEWLNTIANSRILIDQHFLLSRLRLDKEPWNQMRPRYWPSLSGCRAAGNWRVYEIYRRKILEKQLHSRKSAACHSSSHSQNRKISAIDLQYDYDLFSAANSRSPIYRLLVIDGRFATGEPSLLKLTKMAQNSSVPLLLATGDQTSFKISKFDVLSDDLLKPPE